MTHQPLLKRAGGAASSTTTNVNTNYHNVHPPAAGQKGDRETPQEVSRHAQAELEQLEVARHRVCVLMSILTTMVAQGEYF